MNCPHCKHPGADGRNYCGACGTTLVQYCRLCGFRNLTADRYCGGCGAPLGEAPARPDPRPEAAAPAPPPVTPAPVPQAETPPLEAAPLSADQGALDELLAAARDSEKEEPTEGDAKVSQDDIDSLFGD